MVDAERLKKIEEEERARYEIRRRIECEQAAERARPRYVWNPATAASLSLILPGAGQMYKGSLFNGFAWFVLVVVGYLAFIVPGLVLHLCCIIGATLGDPTRLHPAASWVRVILLATTSIFVLTLIVSFVAVVIGAV